MAYSLDQVKYEDEKFVILEAGIGHEIYVKGATCMTRRGQVGFKGEEGLSRVFKMLERMRKDFK